MARIGEMIKNPTMWQILNRAAAEQQWFKDRMAELGHETHTMLWNDLTIADYYGTKAITDTYNKVLKAAKSYNAEKNRYVYDEKVVAELYIVLNWKIHTFYSINNTLARHYDNLWDKCREFAASKLKGEQLTYFYRTTD